MGLLLSLLAALSAGALNGVLVGVLKVTPMLATIGTQSSLGIRNSAILNRIPLEPARVRRKTLQQLCSII